MLSWTQHANLKLQGYKPELEYPEIIDTHVNQNWQGLQLLGLLQNFKYCKTNFLARNLKDAQRLKYLEKGKAVQIFTYDYYCGTFRYRPSNT